MATVGIDVVGAGKVGERSQETPAPARGLTHSAYLNAIASLLDTVVKGGVMAFVTPFVVASLGSSLFGVWQVLGRLVAYMNAADGRPTQALKWVIANRQLVDDDETKRRHVGSAMGVWLLFLPLLVVISGALIWISPVIAKVPADLYTTVRVTCALLVGNFLLIQLISLPESILRGMNLGYKRMSWQAGLNVIGGALTVGALYFGAGLVGIAGAQVVLGILTGLLFVVLVKKYVPWCGIARPTLAEIRSFLKLSVWWFAWSIVQRFLMASDILILSLVASTSAVATYALTSFASLTLLSLVTIVLAAVTPGLGGVIGQKDFERAAALRTEMMTVSWLLLAPIGATILLWNRSFIFLWVGAEHYAGFWANLLIVLMIVQLIFIRNDTYVIDLTLQLREKVLMGTVAAVAAVALSALLIPRLGIAGLCLGMIAGRLALTVSYPLVINKQLAGASRARVLNAVRPAITMGLLFAVATYFGDAILVRNWFVWALGAGLTFAIAFAIALTCGLQAAWRQKLTGRLLLLRTLLNDR